MPEQRPQPADPIEQETKRARTDPDRTLLPSSDGLGPGAGETPSATVSTTPEHRDVVTSTPTLRGVPTHRQRPAVRSSQLDGAPDEKDGE